MSLIDSLRTRHARALGLAIASVGALVGCDSSDATDVEPVHSIYQVPRAGVEQDFYALPFPNDIRLLPDGRIDLSTHQRPNALTEIFIDSIAEHQHGFGLNSPTLFLFDGELDPASLPSSPEASVLEDASVYIVNVEPTSANFGARTRIAARFEVNSGIAIRGNWLSVIPLPGFPLEPSTRYAAIITDRAQNMGSAAVLRSTEFDEIMSSNSLAGELGAAQATLEPLLAWLDNDGGDERDDIVSATVFTTQDATSIMRKIREVIYRDVAAPVPTTITPADVETDFSVFEGLYDGPIFQQGEIPYRRPENGGDIVFDDNGDPIVQSTVSLRFALAVPNGTPPATGWPIVIYAHGTGGSYRTFINNGTAQNLAARGIASISIDQTLHGPRNPGGNPELDYFNFQNPLSARDNTIQGALDDFQLTRLVVDFNETLATQPTTFDDDKIYFFGHSQGALTGVPFVAYEPRIKGAVFSGGGGHLILSLLFKTEPIDISALLGVLIPDKPLNEFNPILGLLQTYLDRSDPINFAKLLVAAPIAGREPVDVFVGLGLTDSFTPVPSIKALATSIGVNPVAPLIEPIEGLRIQGLDALEPPIASNHSSGATAVVAAYEQAPGSDGHFVLFDIPAARTQSIEFLATLAESGVATLVDF